MDWLEAERAVHLRTEAEYARPRREQKASGFRIPPRRDATPKDPYRWHGDERVGARHALATWRRLRPAPDVAAQPYGQAVLAAVDGALEAQHEPVFDLVELQTILDWSRRQIHVVGWEADQAEYRVAWDVYRLLGQLHLLANGAPSIARPWNFHLK